LIREPSQADRDDVEFHTVDLGRPIDPAVLPSSIGAVYHLAQAREFRDFPGSALSTFTINVGTTAFLLDWAYRVEAKSFVYASSGGVYRSAPTPITEDDPLQDQSTLGYYLGGKL